LRLLFAVVAAASLLAVVDNAGSASAAADVRLHCSPSSGSCSKAVDCAPNNHDPGAFDMISIENHGDVAQDLTGWVLKSDPEQSEQMALDVAGTLVPLVDPNEDRVFIVAGRHSESYPDRKTYRWSIQEVLRDAGEPADYIRLFDPSGNLVDSMDCNGQPVPLPTAVSATPTPAPQAAAAANQPAAGETQPSGQSADSQQGRAAAQAAGLSQAAAAAPAGGVGAGAVPAPDSGVGSLAPVGAGSPLFAFGALAAGLAGLATSAILLRRGVRRR
jgi:hypothetical protein